MLLLCTKRETNITDLVAAFHPWGSMPGVHQSVLEGGKLNACGLGLTQNLSRMYHSALLPALLSLLGCYPGLSLNLGTNQVKKQQRHKGHFTETTNSSSPVTPKVTMGLNNCFYAAG